MSGGGQEVLLRMQIFFYPPSVLTSNVDHPNTPPSFERVKLFMPLVLVDRPPHGLISERSLNKTLK